MSQLTLCAHCSQPVPSDRSDAFCCRGCRAVATLLERAGLTRYYDLRQGPGIPVVNFDETRRDRKWLEEIENKIDNSSESSHIQLDIQGVHCSACVWLLETLFERETQRETQGGSILVNPALGSCALEVSPQFPLRKWIEQVESFGYRVGPSNGPKENASDGLLIRAGVALALAGNTMMLSSAIHLGLSDGIVYTWVNRLSFITAILATLIGAPVFVRSAWAGLRRGVLHFDLPIALGMGLALTGSIWSFIRDGNSNYLDTLTAFVALMLLGRWLQTRILERNRRQLLAEPDIDRLLTRVLRDGRSTLIPCIEIKVGDVLMIALGDLVPVASTLIDHQASFSYDWIDGESRPRLMEPNANIPAGVFLVDHASAKIVATETFDHSHVAHLLRNSTRPIKDERSHAGVPKNIGGIYVIGVLVASAIAFLITLIRGFDLVTALDVTTATLVVTCPCAFGIAVPLAYEIVQNQLRRRGIFVRDSSFFERALLVNQIVFDKTGTLTTGKLRLENQSTLLSISPDERSILLNLVSRSNHPKSRAIEASLHDIDDQIQIDPSAVVEETRGSGLTLIQDGHTYQLGSSHWALEKTIDADIVFSRNQQLILAFKTVEDLRPEAALEIKRLRNMGLKIKILSGDTQENVNQIASQIGVPIEDAISQSNPEDKAKWLHEHDASHTMMLGDGINDALALQTAVCSGTPSIERPFTAARSDFYFLTPGLDAVAQTLHFAQRLAKVVRTDLWIAVLYNLFAITICIAGFMKPWLAAILMPSSSLGTIIWTVTQLTRKEKA